MICILIHYQYWKYSLKRKLLANSRIVQLKCGQVEYAVLGKGPIILISHGGGIGYDNIYTYDFLVKAGFQLICPSRPGYLRTKLKGEDSFEAQADMFAALLDDLKIREKVGVIALSMGGPAALQFALRHPHKLKCLVMQDAVSMEYHPSKEAESSLLGKLFLSPYGQNVMSYMMDISTKMFPKSIFKTYLKVESTYDDKKINQILEDVMQDRTEIDKIKLFSRQISPMALRSKGAFDELNLATKIPRYPLEQIKIPTLVTHSKVDGDVPLKHGQFVANSIEGAQLYTFEGCGHMFWFGKEGKKLEKILIEFFRKF